MEEQGFSIDFISCGPFMTNTYLLTSGEESVLIDPGAESQEVVKKLRLSSRNLVSIIATHGHFDHVMDAAVLKSRLGTRFLIGQGEDSILEWSYSVAGKYMGKPLDRIEIDEYLKDGGRIQVGDTTLGIIGLPGHTTGSIGIIAGNSFFTGDTLFRGSIGRTDLGGSMEEMSRTLKKIKSMKPDYRILPGHGPQSTLSHEIENNYYLLDLTAED